MSEEAANATRAVPYGILMSIGSCWLFGWILLIVIAACIDQNLDNVLKSPFGQPMAQVIRSPQLKTQLIRVRRFTMMLSVRAVLSALWHSL